MLVFLLLIYFLLPAYMFFFCQKELRIKFPAECKIYFQFCSCLCYNALSGAETKALGFTVQCSAECSKIQSLMDYSSTVIRSAGCSYNVSGMNVSCAEFNKFDQYLRVFC